VLGLRAVYRVDAFSWCEMATAIPGVSVGLSEVETVTPGSITLTFGVEDIEATRQAMEAKGVRFDGPTQVIHNMVSLAAFFDPDGNRLILAQEL
jgi:predicted enzyme related to lactoylglutathione lyase